ncbi:MAG: WD40 repeat domain-containing protein [Ardenticatenaceae bacterium]|nr:WD40 repeat domain-containing protein [Ardenticatenaceae bacterium]MCB9445742.1 WD40 repeat domain-containing protein [Ardenticatenaceae bacterium]
MKKETYIASAIRHIAPSYNGEIIAAALFEQTVSLWNISNGLQVSEFETILDFGGSRLALSHVECACLTAAYHVHGLACYGTPTGELRWQRKELKKIQQIVITPNGRDAYCCFEEGPCQILDVSTGETTERIRGLRYVWLDPQSAFQLRKSNKLAVVDWNGKQAFQIKPDSFAVLDAVFSKKQLALSESGANVRIFDLASGREVVRHVQPKNHHVLELSFSEYDSMFYGVQWNYHNGGPKLLLRFNPESTETEVVRDLGRPAVVAFCQGGTHLLTSEGDVINCQTGEMVIRLTFPQKEYPKDYCSHAVPPSSATAGLQTESPCGTV